MCSFLSFFLSSHFFLASPLPFQRVSFGLKIPGRSLDCPAVDLLSQWLPMWTLGIYNVLGRFSLNLKRKILWEFWTCHHVRKNLAAFFWREGLYIMTLHRNEQKMLRRFFCLFELVKQNWGDVFALPHFFLSRIFIYFHIGSRSLPRAGVWS